MQSKRRNLSILGSLRTIPNSLTRRLLLISPSHPTQTLANGLLDASWTFQTIYSNSRRQRIITMEAELAFLYHPRTTSDTFETSVETSRSIPRGSDTGM